MCFGADSYTKQKMHRSFRLIRRIVLPRRKEVEYVIEPYKNGFDQEITPGTPVLFMGTSRKVTSHKSGNYAGVYKIDNKVISIKIENVPRFSWQKRTYAILPLKRAFVLSK
jgi:hypothetical protein